MKRWPLSIIAAVIVMGSATAVHSHVKSVAQTKREIIYRSVLQKYSQDVKPRLKRPEVESYLRASNVPFSWMSTVFGGRHERQYTDLVKIGEGPAPWPCSKVYVYVAFEFSGEKFKQNDSDLLERIEIFRSYSGCL